MSATGTTLKDFDLDNFYSYEYRLTGVELESKRRTQFGDLKYYAFGSGENDLKITKVDLRKTQLNCAPGQYDDGSSGNSDICQKCQPGSYQPERRKQSCLKTDTGYYQDDEIAIAQKICPPGTYSDEMGQTECTLGSLIMWRWISIFFMFFSSFMPQRTV